MVKHNKIIPNQHFHKKWQTSSRGPLHIKSWFNQPGKKKSRRTARQAKAAAIAPRRHRLRRLAWVPRSPATPPPLPPRPARPGSRMPGKMGDFGAASQQH